MPEVTRVRARDLGRVIDVRADWCQTAATGHRMRVDITLWRSRRPISTILRARSTAPCSQAVVRRTGLSPGRYVVSVKIKDQTTGMVTPTPELLRGTLTVVR